MTQSRTVQDRLVMREYARQTGDRNLEMSCNADLFRNGYRDETPRRGEPLETAVPDVEMERAVPPSKRGGRPKLPRCEHDQIVGRCPACEEGADDD